MDFFNEFGKVDNLSVDAMLNRILCAMYMQDPLGAALLLAWYALVSVNNLNDSLKLELMQSYISSLVCCTINDEFSMNDALETVMLIYQEMDIIHNKNTGDKEMPIPEKVCYDIKINAQVAAPAMNIKAYSKIHHITVEEAIEQKIEEMCPDNHNLAKDAFFKRVIAATIKQSHIQVGCTLLTLSAFLLSNITDTVPFEKRMEELRTDCAENLETSYKYRRIEELKEKIYRHN